MTSRDFIKLAGFALIVAIMPLFVYGDEGKNNPKSKPNIVFIFADDMGFGDVNCQNPESKIPTPNLDKLATQGLRFTDAHTASSVCSPSRYGLLTGRYCWRSSMKRSVVQAWDKPLIEKDRLTVAQLLKDNGYHTACIGKWHLGWNWPTSDGEPAKKNNGLNLDYTQPITGGPTAFGFDYYWGDDIINHPPYVYIKNDRVLRAPTEYKKSGDWGTMDSGPLDKDYKIENVLPDLTKKSVEYIHEHAKSNAPFFLYFPLNAPHEPIAPSKAFQGSTKVGPYGDLIHQIDWVVGEIVQALEENGIAENTLLIFSSDNGSPAKNGKGHNGQIGSFIEDYGYSPNNPWRGFKGDIWEAGHRVPFLVRWPNRVPANQTSDEPLCLTDFMATIAAMLGKALPMNAGEDSYNMLQVFEGKKQDKPIREAIVHHSLDGLFSIRQGKWKLIFGPADGGFTKYIRGKPKLKAGDPVWQLYDLSIDPKEEKNLIKDHPDITKELTAKLRDYIEKGRSTPGTPQKNHGDAIWWKELPWSQPNQP